MMGLLLRDPMWMAILGITLALHVAFYFGIRWLMRQDPPKAD